MLRVRIVVFVASLAVLTACANTCYRSNLQHARVTPWTHISPADRERVVWLVSHATHQPIIGISEDTMCVRYRCLWVITGYGQSDMQPWTAVKLQKRSTDWRITQISGVSHIIATDILSIP